MNIFGIGPGELILIMIILLVVVGPDRLPGLARQGGQMLVRVRNWVQHSPDAAMVLRARQEIEQELASLRASLMEVQSARDEMMAVAKQVNQTITEDLGGAVKDITKTINDESRKVMQGVTDATKAADTATQAAEHAIEAAESGTPVADALANGVSSAVENGATSAADTASHGQNGQPVARARTRSDSFAPKTAVEPAAQTPQPGHADGYASASVATAELRMLAEQMQTMLRDMQSLRQEVREHGLLSATWQPPSATAAPAEEAPALAPSIVTEPEERPQ